MHRVVKAHLTDFVSKFDVAGDQSKQFEAFVNYSIFRRFCGDQVDPDSLVYDGEDPGIDGFMSFVEDSYVESVDEVEDALKSTRRDANVSVVFVQSKTSETWKKSEINTFQAGILDFLSDAHNYPHAEYLENGRDVFDAILSKVGRIRNGKPNARIYFATTARESTDRGIIAARDSLTSSVIDTGLFHDVEVVLIDRDSIVDLWTSSEGSVEATLKLLGNAPFPATPGIDESYVVTVRAQDFIESILTDKNGKFRQRIFDENVRDFIGVDSDVNAEMGTTLQDASRQNRFGILNNGVTIIAPDVRLSAFEMFLRDFQIVNGCQTSNVLFQNKDIVDGDATLVLKIVETSDPSVVDDIVRSTNRQTKVEESQFLATLDAIKMIDKYFVARAEDDEYRLFFERRTDQFNSHENVKAIRVFDIKEIARCVAAMFLDKPDLASRYPNRLTGEMRDLVFDSSYREEVFYVAAYSLYRIRLLLASRKIDGRFVKLRWHILLAIRYYVCGESLPNLSSAKVEKNAKEIREFVEDGGDARISELNDLCAAIVEIDDMTRDKVRNSALTLDVKAKALELRKSVLAAKIKGAKAAVK
ncbi:AIPR family protein [Rhodococcoides fascians]|uniref:AIPR family protein n=1 Tax=Rhodococcoides fascians TaxID=1828 RepID=UPI0015C6235A|nr:AIPR family protein [Rhodococcus fascians]